MSEKKSIKWVRKGTKSIILNWNIQTFKFSSTIVWRGRTIVLSMKIKRTNQGHEKDIKLTYKDRIIKDETYNWKNQEYQYINITPFTIDDNTRLKMAITSHCLVFTDSLLAGTKNITYDSSNVFCIKNSREYIELPKPNHGNEQPLNKSYKETITLHKNTISKDYNHTTAYFLQDNLYISRISLTNSKRVEHIMIITDHEVSKLTDALDIVTKKENIILKVIANLNLKEKYYETLKYFFNKKNIRFEEMVNSLNQ